MKKITLPRKTRLFFHFLAAACSVAIATKELVETALVGLERKFRNGTTALRA